MHRLAAPFALLLLACAAPAAAQTAIHHCIGANGGAVFTDQPCAALEATPVAPVTRDGVPAATLSAPPPILCAASPEALRQGVIDAFARRDANRLAGLMLWQGYGRAGVVASIRALDELVKQSLLDVELPGDAAPVDAEDPFASFAAPPPDNELVLHLAGDDGTGNPRVRRFGIVREAGCLWLGHGE